MHNVSARAAFPFVSVRCYGLSDVGIDREFFGWNSRRDVVVGKFELADKGTLFFDEISELPLAAQDKILRFVDDKQIMRAGDEQMREVDVRFIFSTTKDLAKLVEQGAFREDLYYRISFACIKVPSLQERGDDALLLIDACIEEYCRLRDEPPIVISEEARIALARHAWPGNVRQLQSTVRYLCDFAKNRMIGIEDVRRRVLGEAVEDDGVATVKETLKSQIIAALRSSNYNVAQAAKALGIGRSTLYSYMKKYDIR